MVGSLFFSLKMKRPIIAAPAKAAPTAAKRRVLSVPHWAVISSGDVMTVEPLARSEEKLPAHPENL